MAVPAPDPLPSTSPSPRPAHAGRIAPSLLAADPLALGDELATVHSADYLHVDVMDGVYVGDVSWGPRTVAACIEAAVLPVEAHLMVADPERWAPVYAKLGCWQVTVHVEACDDPRSVLQSIRAGGARAGLAFGPHSDLDAVARLAEELDCVLVMTVEPGAGGSPMLAHASDRCARARNLLDARRSPALLAADGGITPSNIGSLALAGVESFVVGTALFGAQDRLTRISELRLAAR